MTSTKYSIRSSPRNQAEWEWACRFAARSSGHMNGRIWVTPNKPEGAVFQFMLLANGATSVDASRGE